MRYKKQRKDDAKRSLAGKKNKKGGYNECLSSNT